MQRNQGLDVIRVLLTFLVIVHHVAIVYGGAGSWYWKGVAEVNPFLMAFNALNQSYFMGMFFLIAGYFSRASIDRKGVRCFIKDRAVRLGIPLIFYFFVISPLTIAIAMDNGRGLLSNVSQAVRNGNFEPGPLWFVLTLLVFSSILGLFSLVWPTFSRSIKSFPKNSTLLLVLFVTALITFILRLYIPVGQTVFWLQLGYFPMYILLFGVGYCAYTERLLFYVSWLQVWPWLLVSAVLIIVLPIIIFHPLGSGPFEGGFNANAAFYALWEPFVACGVILGLLYFVNNSGKPKLSRLAGLAPLAYCIYIIHPLVVVIVSLLLAGAALGITVKLVLNSGLSIGVCVLLAAVIVKLPLVRRVL